MAGFGDWFGRRVLRADLRDDDVAATTGGSVLRFGQYLDESRRGRLFWLAVSVVGLVVFVGLPPLLVLSLWERPDLDRGDPFRAALVGVVTMASWWCALLWQGSVRAMVRARSEPRPDDEGAR